MFVATLFYTVSLVWAAPFAKRGSNSLLMPLKHVENYYYTASLEFGSPPQTVDLVLDSGSADTWLMCSSNPFCASSANASNGTYEGEPITTTIDCQGLSPFSVNASSTLRNLDIGRFFINYTDGSFADGYWATDTISAEGDNVSGMQFGIAQEATAEVSGILGVGFQRRESVRGYTGAPYKFYKNFPQVLKEKGIINTVAYAMYLNDPNADHGSVLFGAVDPSKYIGELYTFPMVNTYPAIVSRPATLAMTLQGFGAENNSQQQTFTTTKSAVLLDSGTSLMAAPQEMVAKMAQFVDANATFSEDDGVYTITCPAGDDDTEFVFDFGDLEIAVPLSTLILTPTEGSLCGLGAIPTDDDSWTLGDVFLSYTYLVFDLDNYLISMAKAKFSEDGDQEASMQINSDGTIPGAIKASAEPWTTDEPFTVTGSIFGNANATFTPPNSSSSNSPSYNTSSSGQGLNKVTSMTTSETRSTSSSMEASEPSGKTASNSSPSSDSSSSVGAAPKSSSSGSNSPAGAAPKSSTGPPSKGSSTIKEIVYTSIVTKFIYATTLTTGAACTIS